MKRILICGSREFSNWDIFWNALHEIAWCYFARGPLDNQGNFTYAVTVICGGAKGADTLAMEWAAIENVNLEIYLAEWDKFGKSAGYRRNKRMLDEGKPDIVIAFPGGIGTKMMVDIARLANVKIIKVNVTPAGSHYVISEDTAGSLDPGAEEYEQIMEAIDLVDKMSP
jgi:hypothetical protein